MGRINKKIQNEFLLLTKIKINYLHSNCISVSRAMIYIMFVHLLFALLQLLQANLFGSLSLCVCIFPVVVAVAAAILCFSRSFRF